MVSTYVRRLKEILWYQYTSNTFFSAFAKTGNGTSKSSSTATYASGFIPVIQGSFLAPTYK